MIYIANSNWYPTENNPFSSDGLYGKKWSAFIYDDRVLHCTNVYENAKVYTIRFPFRADKGYVRLFDFLSYETAYGRDVILKAPEDLNMKEVLAQYDNIDQKVSFRDTDEPYMVHSTTLQNWDSIQKDGAIFSPNMLRRKGRPIQEIGLKALLEPDDYSDYIMLDKTDGCGELVVHSRQLGRVCLDPNCLYTPGVRLYFDIKKMIRDELIVRDGFHILKVQDSLPLQNYLVAAITAQNFSSSIHWTPTRFTEMANRFFYNYRAV